MPICEPSAASLAVTGYVPTVSTPVVSTPTAATLALTAAAPVVTATVTAASLASSQQSVGVKLEMDLDGGGLAEIPLFDAANYEGVAAELEIEESMDNTGGDRLSLTLIGNGYSALTSDELRGKRQVALTGYHARPGEVLTYANAFNGYLFSCEQDVFPPTSRLTILDAAAAYNTPLVYSLDSGHGLTRAQVVTAICALSPAIPTGTIALGTRGSVALQKPISEGGTRGRLDFLAEYLAPCGVRVFFSGGNLQILPYDTSPTSVRTITPDLICLDGASISLPDLSRATKVTVTSTSLTVTAPGNTRNETETETTTALYQPLYAVNVQHSDGTIESINVPGIYPDECAETTREVYKKTTSRDYDGATLTGQTVTEYRYYARKATQRTYAWDGNGDPITDATWDVPGYDLYQYSDGLWYVDPYESQRIVQKSVLTRSFDGDDYLLTEVEEKYYYQFIRACIWGAGTGGEFGAVVTPVYITDSDEGVTNYYERIGLPADRNAVDERTTTTYYRTTGGQIDHVDKVTESFGIGARRPYGASNSYVYGLTARVFAATTPAWLGGARTTTTESYKQWSQNRYTYTKHLSIRGGAPAGAGDYTEPVTIEERIGNAPYLEKKESHEVAAAVTASVTDSVRLAINGTVELVQDNQWCESAADCTALAESIRRDESAIQLTIETPFCWDLHKNDWITITIPSLGISAKKMYIYGLTRSLSNFRVRLSLLWYPAEVA